MRRRASVIMVVAALVAAVLPAAGAVEHEEALVLSGVLDGPLSGGVPKAIELTAVTAIADLSVYALESANNGNPAAGPEFTLPASPLEAGGVIHVASESSGFESFFGVPPTFTSDVASINGDDAIVLYRDGDIVDVFGEVGVDGSGQPWEYLDGWAKRVAETGPDGATFILENWCFSGPNALDGETANADATVPFPVGATPCPETDPPGPELVKIHEVQGTGDDSPLEGERVVVEGVVVGDYETFDRLAGFFVQEEDADADADPLTSEGVFVFNFLFDTVEVGDLVRVEGTVEERFGNTQLGDFTVVEVLGSGEPLPSPTEVSFPLFDRDDLEAVEGMLARFSQTLVVSEYFNFDRFGEVVVGLPLPGEDRQYQPTAVEDDLAAIEARAEWNELARITIDDGQTSQNPDDVIHPVNRAEFTLDNRFRGGDEATGLVGPIWYSFGQHRLLPTSYETYAEENRPASPTDVGGRLTVAAFNALNYFLTIDEGPDVCGADADQDCRGADTQAEFERQRAKLLETLVGIDADVIGLNEIENTPGVEPLADLVDGLNDVYGPGTYAWVETGVAGTDAIKVGIIYKATAVTQVGETAVLDTTEFLDPNGTGQDKNRAAVAATFLEKGTGEKFSVVVNHLKSKGSGCGPGDDDPFAGSCNLTRTLAAAELVRWIGTNPTDQKDSDWLIIGDLNSYDEEDPIRALEAAGYTDLLDAYEGELAYTYVFDGQFGHLDYAMANESMLAQVTGATSWHVNADEPDILDYDLSFKSPTQAALFAIDPFRSSDHDPVLVGLDLDQKPGKGNKGEAPGRNRP